MKCFSALAFLAVIFFIFGCGGQKAPGNDNKTAANTTVSDDSDEAVIRNLMTEYIERVREGDKTVLYENEFMYYKDIISLTEYYEYPRVRDYVYNTLSHVVTDSVEILGDSAFAWIRLFYLTDEPDEGGHPYQTTFYRSMGRWYRPYLSRWEQQLELEEEMRAYEEAVKREQTEKEGK